MTAISEWKTRVSLKLLKNIDNLVLFSMMFPHGQGMNKQFKLPRKREMDFGEYDT